MKNVNQIVTSKMFSPFIFRFLQENFVVIIIKIMYPFYNKFDVYEQCVAQNKTVANTPWIKYVAVNQI